MAQETELFESIKILQMKNGGLKQELETSNVQQVNMDERVSGIESLMFVKSMALNILLETVNFLKESKAAFEKLKDVYSNLQCENDNLKQELETKCQLLDLTQQLLTSSEEKEVLNLEVIEVLTKTQQIEKDIEKQEVELNPNPNLATEKSSETAELLLENTNLKNQVEADDQQVADLMRKLENAEEENHTLHSDILRLMKQMEVVDKTIKALDTDCELLKDEKLKLLNTNGDLKQDLRVKDGEMRAVSLKSSEAVDELEKINQAEQMLLIEVEKFLLQGNYDDLEFIVEGAKGEVSDLKKEMQRSQEERWRSSAQNITVLDKMQQADKAKDDLETEIEPPKSHNSKLQVKVDDLVLELDAVNHHLPDRNNKLKPYVEENAKLTAENRLLLSKVKDVETELEQLKSDDSKLQVTNHRLTDGEDKLKYEKERAKLAAGTLLSLKKEQYENDVKETRNEIARLKEENSGLQQSNTELLHRSSEIEEKIKEKLTELFVYQHELEVVTMKAFSDFKIRTSHANDLQRELDLLYAQKEELKEQIKSFTQMVTENLKLWTIVEADLNSKISSQENMLTEHKQLLANHKLEQAAKSTEVERLLGVAAQSEKQMEELEKRLREKEAEVLSKDEEKREAIRQLCLLIEYHRENYNHLHVYLATRLSERRQFYLFFNSLLLM